MIDYQVSDHGAGRKSVQLFERPSGKLVADVAVVRDVNGWRIAGQSYDTPQHASPEAAAKHYATLVASEGGA